MGAMNSLHEYRERELQMPPELRHLRTVTAMKPDEAL
jgi:hypothetical protein